MHITVEKKVVNVYPDLKIFSFIIEDYTPESILYSNEIDLNLPEHISNIPIIKQWREIYRNMGLKPTKYYSSIEALLKRYKKGNWQTGNQFIDLYNSFSIQYMTPMGAYNLENLENLTFRFARIDDSYNPLHSNLNFEINNSLIVYAQSNKVACWAINHRDSEDFCVNNQTSKILIVAEGITSEQSILAEEAINSFHNFCKSKKYRVSNIFTHILSED